MQGNWKFVRNTCLKEGVPHSKRPFWKAGIDVYIYGSTALGRFFSFFVFYAVGGNSRTGDQPVARPLPARRTAQTHNKHTETSKPQVGFEATIPVFKRAKTVHALDCAAVGMDRMIIFKLRYRFYAV
jgi:hypothetical protein